MGWNIAGFAINKNYQNDIDGLSKALMKSEKSHLVEGRNKYTFETAATFGSSKGRMDFMFTNKGSFAFCNVMETPYILGSRNPELLQGTEMILFAMSEIATTFMIKYYVDGVKTREIQSIEGIVKESFGEPLEVEKQKNDMVELISSITNNLIGVPFDGIDPRKTFTRYVKKKNVKKSNGKLHLCNTLKSAF
jgi:hypothetical protein